MMDAVITNAAQFTNTQFANTQLRHGFVNMTYGLINTRFANVAVQGFCGKWFLRKTCLKFVWPLTAWKGCIVG